MAYGIDCGKPSGLHTRVFWRAPSPLHPTVINTVSSPTQISDSGPADLAGGGEAEEEGGEQEEEDGDQREECARAPGWNRRGARSNNQSACMTVTSLSR